MALYLLVFLYAFLTWTGTILGCDNVDKLLCVWHRDQCEGGKSSRTTELIRKNVYSNMKLYVSAYSGHHQVSIPLKGGLYI